jgi:hypothetical protein
MGTEILGFDPERAAAAAGSSSPAPPSSEPVLDLVDLDVVGPVDAATPPPSRGGLRGWLTGWRTEPGRRQRLARTLVLVMLVMVATAAVTQQRADHQARQRQDARLAVDLRVDALPALDDPRTSQAPRGQSFLQLRMHNLGERPVQLTGLLYRLSDDPVPGHTLLDTDVTVLPGRLVNRGFPVTLPCGPTAATAVTGLATMTALVRTADGVTHVVPTDVSTLDEMGGVFGACSVYAHVFGDYDAATEYQADGVRITLSLPPVQLVGSNFVQLDMNRGELPAGVTFVTSPRLPREFRAGTRVSVLVRPVVRTCRGTESLTAMTNVGVRIGSDLYPDPFLPLTVARAIGRACPR